MQIGAEISCRPRFCGPWSLGREGGSNIDGPVLAVEEYGVSGGDDEIAGGDTYHGIIIHNFSSRGSRREWRVVVCRLGRERNNTLVSEVGLPVLSRVPSPERVDDIYLSIY